MKPVVLLLCSTILSFAQTNRFQVYGQFNANGSLLIVKTDLSTGQSWRYDDTYQGIEIVASEAGQKLKQRLEKIVIGYMDPLDSFSLSEAVEVLSRTITISDLVFSPKNDGATKGSNNQKKNQSGFIRAIDPKGIAGGSVAADKLLTNTTGVSPGITVTGVPAPGVPGVATNAAPGIGVKAPPGIPGGAGAIPAIPGVPGGVPGFPIFILSGIRSTSGFTGSFTPGIDSVTGMPLASGVGGMRLDPLTGMPLEVVFPPGIDPRTGVPLGGAGGGPNINQNNGMSGGPPRIGLATGMSVAPGSKPKVDSGDDNKTSSASPPGGGAPSGLGEPGMGGGLPRMGGGLPGMGGGLPGMGGGLPGMGGGLPGMGGGLPGMGGSRKQHDHGIDPDMIKINGMRGPVANITAYAALHLVLSLADVPLHCAIDEHGVFILPPNEPFRFLDGNKPKFSKTGRWIEIDSSE